MLHVGLDLSRTQGVGKVRYVRPDLRRYASRGPDRVPGPPVWLPACKVIALCLARSARRGGPSASDTSTSVTRPHRLPAASAQVRALGDDFADPLGCTPVRASAQVSYAI